MHLEELDYALPEALIAQRPAARREDARLMVLPFGLPSVVPSVVHARVSDLCEGMPPALWVVNDTRVFPARLPCRKPSGGRSEVLLLEPLPAFGQDVCAEGSSLHGEPAQRWRGWVRGLAKLGVGSVLQCGSDVVGLEVVVESVEDSRTAVVELRVPQGQPGSVPQRIATLGEIPLPPYIRRNTDEQDRERYQTVFARDMPPGERGAVAAPTAGLHFSRELVQQLTSLGHRFAQITLHVGPGTFLPVMADSLEEHDMHREWLEVPQGAVDAIGDARTAGMPVMAVGTTVVRALESAALESAARLPDMKGSLAPYRGTTDLMIAPPFRFRVVDGLLTNFHLPKSTLLALVMAMAGKERLRSAYRAAVDAQYRFYSYGDAMLVGPKGVDWATG